MFVSVCCATAEDIAPGPDCCFGEVSEQVVHENSGSPQLENFLPVRTGNYMQPFA